MTCFRLSAGRQFDRRPSIKFLQQYIFCCKILKNHIEGKRTHTHTLARTRHKLINITTEQAEERETEKAHKCKQKAEHKLTVPF